MAISYALVREEQASGTNGGSAVAGAWTTRVLNTVAYDPTSMVSSLSANAFTLNAGTFVLQASSPMFGTSQVSNKVSRIRIFNQTGSAVVVYGISCWFYNAANQGGNAQASAVVTISSPTAYRIEYFAGNAQATNGLGTPASIASTVEVYTQVQIFKIA